MSKPPLHLVGAGNRPFSTGQFTIETMDRLDRAGFRVRFLLEMISAVNPDALQLSRDGLEGLGMVLGDVDMDLSEVRQGM